MLDSSQGSASGTGEPMEDRPLDFSKWGVVRGTVRSASGQPAAYCGIWGEPTTLPADAMTLELPLTDADGSYYLHLPAATYTIKAHGGTSPATSLSAEVVGVAVTGGSDTVIDITITEEQD
jgi:hypothetical protein